MALVVNRWFILTRESYTLEWDIGFYDNTGDFIDATEPRAYFSGYPTHVGQSITVESTVEPTSPCPGLRIKKTGQRFVLSAGSPGTYQVDLGDSRTEISFHAHSKVWCRRGFSIS